MHHGCLQHPQTNSATQSMSSSIPLPTLSLTLTKTHFPLLFSPSTLPKPSFSSSSALSFRLKSFVSNCSISNSNHSDNDRDEHRWLREEQRWLREEQRWLREEQRWARERDSLLREISDLKLHIQALERRASTHDVSPDAVANVLQVLEDRDLVLDSESSLRRMVLEQNQEKEEQEEAIEREKEIVVIEEAASATVQKKTTLRKGSEGEQVRELQEALLKLGFYSGEEDMEYFSFSSGTDRAVKTWQAAIGVPEDGVMTTELLERLYLEISTKDAGNANENANSATVLPKEGENGAAVASVTEIPEVKQKVEEKGDAGIQSSHRGVFLLGENRWEEPSRLVASDGVDRGKNKDATKKCLQCRGEGRLLCTECDGSGEPNIEPQFLEWVDEDTKCPYCDGLGYTPCDLCGGKTIV